MTDRLEECWRQAAVDSPWLAEQTREHQLLEGFAARLRAQERRLVEVEAALASAPASVKERLAQLREHSVAELEHSLGLVEELVAQLTLLRFADLGNPSAVNVERGGIEELLLRSARSRRRPSRGEWTRLRRRPPARRARGRGAANRAHQHPSTGAFRRSPRE